MSNKDRINQFKFGKSENIIVNSTELWYILKFLGFNYCLDSQMMALSEGICNK